MSIIRQWTSRWPLRRIEEPYPAGSLAAGLGAGLEFPVGLGSGWRFGGLGAVRRFRLRLAVLCARRIGRARGQRGFGADLVGSDFRVADRAFEHFARSLAAFLRLADEANYYAASETLDMAACLK